MCTNKAKNEIVAFLDADGVPNPYWLDRIRKQFEDTKVHFDGIGKG